MNRSINPECVLIAERLLENGDVLTQYRAPNSSCITTLITHCKNQTISNFQNNFKRALDQALTMQDREYGPLGHMLPLDALAETHPLIPVVVPVTTTQASIAP